MKKVIVTVGCRPDCIKMMPLVKELRKKYREFCESQADCSSCKYKDDCSELVFSYDLGRADMLKEKNCKECYSKCLDCDKRIKSYLS